MMTAPGFARVGCSVVEVFGSIADAVGGGQVPFLVLRLYEDGRFALEVFEPIRELGRGWNG